MQSPLLKQLLERYSSLKRRRSTWEDQFDQIQRFVRPNVPSFRSRELTKGKNRHDEIYDGTASWALEQFSAGLSSHVTNSRDRWFQLGFEGIPMTELPFPVLEYLEAVADRIFHVYALSDSSHAPSLHEGYLDIGAFGTAVIYQHKGASSPLQFRSFPLADCFVEENSEGLIDVCFRRLFMTKRQVIQAFPKAEMDDKVQKAQDNETFEIVHACFPRTDRDPKALSVRNKPFASIYFCEQFDDVLEEHGSDEFVYHIPRWAKISGETYGRSPVMSVLPDIKMLNQMKKEILYSAQVANRPPLSVDNDSMLFPVKTITPGSIIYKEPGAEPPQPIVSGSQPQQMYELIGETREAINRALFIDFLLRPKKNERQTTMEIMDDRSEMLRQMEPMLGRLQNELLGPMVERSFALLGRANLLPEPPPMALEFAGVPFEITYISPAAKAQLGTKVSSITQYLQDVGQLAQFDPTVTEIIDAPALMGEMAKLRDVSPKVLKDPREIAKMKRQQEQAQQVAQATEAAPAVAGAMKDIAQARETDPSILQGLA